MEMPDRLKGDIPRMRATMYSQVESWVQHHRETITEQPELDVFDDLCAMAKSYEKRFNEVTKLYDDVQQKMRTSIHAETKAINDRNLYRNIIEEILYLRDMARNDY